jgi:hypothetical protein
MRIGPQVITRLTAKGPVPLSVTAREGSDETTEEVFFTTRRK